MNQQQKFREDQIIRLLGEMSSTFFDLQSNNDLPEEIKTDYDYLEDQEELEATFIRKSDEVYKLIISYLETAGQHNLLATFKQEAGPVLRNKDILLEGEYDRQSGDVYSKTVALFRSFLSAFEFSAETYANRLLKQAGITYLETILNATHLIVEESKVTIEKETDVYNAVKWFIKIVYPSSLHPGPGFLKPFKKYNPDALIPELKVAVEYKYARTAEDLKNQFGEIGEDVLGYTDNPTYELFYVVFFVAEDFWGRDGFKAQWEALHFPEHWRPIYVVKK